jgi:KUP system potassium uptake protein
LSAIEGIKLYAPETGRFIAPLTAVILVLLFAIQRKGTSWIGGVFGPIMLIWFIVIGILGLLGIAREPAVLAAVSPLPAISYLWHAGLLSLAVIGGAFLAVTGAEAFYADMGHFGRGSPGLAWRCRRSLSITSAKAPCFSLSPVRSTTPSTSLHRNGRITVWCSLRR